MKSHSVSPVPLFQDVIGLWKEGADGKIVMVEDAGITTLTNLAQTCWSRLHLWGVRVSSCNCHPRVLDSRIDGIQDRNGRGSQPSKGDHSTRRRCRWTSSIARRALTGEQKGLERHECEALSRSARQSSEDERSALARATCSSLASVCSGTGYASIVIQPYPTIRSATKNTVTARVMARNALSDFVSWISRRFGGLEKSHPLESRQRAI